jgi:phosphoribosylamine--glycine ligase
MEGGVGLKILVAGAGGREHALLWKLAQSPKTGELFCAPGNGGTTSIAQNLPIRSRDVERLVAAARDERIDLAIVGPEEPLAAGLADGLIAAGIPVFGPTKAAARIETSKAYAKELMTEIGVPTARAAIVHELVSGLAALSQFSIPVVIKADGLAGGRGVVIAHSRAEAQVVLTAFLDEDVLGPAGRTVLIEEYLDGEELSLFAVTDSERLLMLPPVRDFKRLLDRNRGPNTAGMGAVVTPDLLDPETQTTIEQTIFQPVLAELARRGSPFRGMFYAGLIVTDSGPKVLEFNARFGDPETQALLPVLDVDLVDLCLAAANGSLADMAPIPPPTQSSVAVVLASGGYPGPHRTGLPIEGVSNLPADVLLFHGATRRSETDQLITDGGRVLTLVGLGNSLETARARAYAGVDTIGLDNAHARRDIGTEGLESRI